MRDDLEVKGKESIAIHTKLGIKLIIDVLLVLKISQFMLSVGQMIDKQY